MAVMHARDAQGAHLHDTWQRRHAAQRLRITVRGLVHVSKHRPDVLHGLGQRRHTAGEAGVLAAALLGAEYAVPCVPQFVYDLRHCLIPSHHLGLGPHILRDLLIVRAPPSVNQVQTPALVLRQQLCAAIARQRAADVERCQFKL